jgi:hypothetical protein
MSDPAIGPEMAKLFRRLRVRRNFGAVRSPGAQVARLNALLAVERDPGRFRERELDLRLGATVFLAPRIEVAEALLAGVPPRLPARSRLGSGARSLRRSRA